MAQNILALRGLISLLALDLGRIVLLVERRLVAEDTEKGQKKWKIAKWARERAD